MKARVSGLPGYEWDENSLNYQIRTHLVIGSVFQAEKLGLTGEDYAWIVEGRPEERWWTAEQGGCSAERLSSAAEGVILVSALHQYSSSKPHLSPIVSMRILVLR